MTPTALGERVEDNNTGGGEQERRVPDKGLDIIARPIMKYTKTNYPKNTFIMGEAVLALVFGAIAIGLYAIKVPAHEPISPLIVKAQDLPEVEVESKRPSPSEKQQILLYIVEKFGDDAADAITLVRKCENSTFDQTRTNHNQNGTVDYGIFQVNSIHTNRYGETFKTDWKANVDVAYKIYQAAGNKFTPWTCAHIIGQKNYLGK